MGLVVALLFFVFASISAASKGDFSGLEMIGKFVLFIVLFVAIGTIIIHPVLLVVAVLIGIALIMCK